ncbi:MAG: hypothetical protein CL881_03850 [Dehalococcoidia bacterium]|nr:hypothetical protein [Dehalococcoidia bacterium]
MDANLKELLNEYQNVSNSFQVLGKRKHSESPPSHYTEEFSEGLSDDFFQDLDWDAVTELISTTTTGCQTECFEKETQKQITELESDNTLLTEKITVLESNVLQKNTRITLLEDDNTLMTEEIRVLQSNVLQKDTRITLLEDDNTLMTEEIKALGEENQNLKDELKRVTLPTPPTNRISKKVARSLQDSFQNALKKILDIPQSPQ